MLVAADCVELLADASTPPVCDVEILVFADEEESGSDPAASAAARLPVGTCERAGAGRCGRREASGSARRPHPRGRPLESASRDPRTLGAFLEIHIEQGRALEQLDLPIGVVSAIAGNTRAELRFDGLSGHAGTVPMGERHDALAAAAAWTVEVERRVSEEPELVGTVGALSALPGQVNVIAGSARATLDVRGPDDAERRRVVEQLRRDAEHQAGLRGARVTWTETLDRPAVPMDPRLLDDARRALARSGQEPPVLVSGAGHDAAVMASLCPTLLLFVRCREGLSHHPDEHVAPEDVRSALEATDIVLEGVARGVAAVTDRQHLLAVARGDEPADLVVRDARVFSVFTREWLAGDVAVADGRFAGIGSYVGEETLDARGSMLVPGFIDAHVHIESSMLTLERFAEVVLATGTTTIVADPHELANVVGSKGVHWLLDAAEHVPLNVFVMAPSCVPASRFESPRGPLDLEEMEGILSREGALGVRR